MAMKALPRGPWCCERGRRFGKTICDRCDLPYWLQPDPWWKRLAHWLRSQIILRCPRCGEFRMTLNDNGQCWCCYADDYHEVH